MNISKTDHIAGYPATTIRQLLRIYSKSEGTTEQLAAQVLRTSLRHAATTLHLLTQQGYLDVDTDSLHGIRYWTPTIQGRALAQALQLPPITRERAQQILDAFLARVRHANADPYYFLGIQTIDLFGSMTSLATHINDLDLIVTLDWKPHYDTENSRSQLLQQRIHEARQGHRKFRNATEAICWPQEELLRFIRKRHPRIRLHHPFEIDALHLSPIRLYPDSTSPKQGTILIVKPPL